MQYVARVVLNESVASFVADYIKYVRQPIMSRTNTASKNVLLQYDGKPFDRVGQALGEAQERLRMTKTISISDARKTHETFAFAC